MRGRRIAGADALIGEDVAADRERTRIWAGDAFHLVLDGGGNADFWLRGLRECDSRNKKGEMISSGAETRMVRPKLSGPRPSVDGVLRIPQIRQVRRPTQKS